MSKQFLAIAGIAFLLLCIVVMFGIVIGGGSDTPLPEVQEIPLKPQYGSGVLKIATVRQLQDYHARYPNDCARVGKPACPTATPTNTSTATSTNTATPKPTGTADPRWTPTPEPCTPLSLGWGYPDCKKPTEEPLPPPIRTMVAAATHTSVAETLRPATPTPLPSNTPVPTNTPAKTPTLEPTVGPTEAAMIAQARGKATLQAIEAEAAPPDPESLAGKAQELGKNAKGASKGLVDIVMLVVEVVMVLIGAFVLWRWGGDIFRGIRFISEKVPDCIEFPGLFGLIASGIAWWAKETDLIPAIWTAASILGIFWLAADIWNAFFKGPVSVITGDLKDQVDVAKQELERRKQARQQGPGGQTPPP